MKIQNMKILLSFCPLLIGLFCGQVYAANRVCTGAFTTTSSPTGVTPISGLTVDINNSSLFTKKAIVHVSADTGVDTGAEVRLTYSMDGGPEFVAGPTNLANHTEFWQTRNSMAIINIPPGLHVIRPLWRVSGVAGKSAQMVTRCISIAF
ncbi:MAG: hypothetical protein ABL933_13450 [Methyloglobulus sp.]